MAGGTVRRHPDLADDADVDWQIIERTAELGSQQIPLEGAFFEDSELTIILDWAQEPPGTLSSGLTTLEPATPGQRVALYVLNLESYVGRIAFHLHDSRGHRIVSNEFEVQRRKLASDGDLAEMERHWTLTHIPIDPGVSRRIYDQATVRPGESTPAQWAMLARHLFQPLSTAARSIHHRPKKSVEETTRAVTSRQVRRPSVSPVLSILKGRRRVQINAPEWGPDPGARALAAQDARRILDHIRRLRDELEEGEALDPELDRTMHELEGHLRSIVRKGSLRQKPRVRQAILHDPRYRILRRASLLSRRAVELEPGPLSAFRPPTSRLYEEWCAWAMVEELADPKNHSRLRSELGTTYRGRKLELRTEPRQLSMELQHEMAIGQWRHRPDLVLRLEDKERVVLLDVKYRGEGEELTTVPSDAIAELHRYRDVFKLKNKDVQHKETWAAILHPAPGWQDAVWKASEAFEMAVNEEFRVGAVPLSPSLRRPLVRFIEELDLTGP